MSRISSRSLGLLLVSGLAWGAIAASAVQPMSFSIPLPNGRHAGLVSLQDCYLAYTTLDRERVGPPVTSFDSVYSRNALIDGWDWGVVLYQRTALAVPGVGAVGVPRRTWAVWMPLPAALLTAVATWSLRRDWKPRPSLRGRCEPCRYALSTSPGPCPKCGTPVSPAAPR
jgi:hypothetical protein